MRRAIAAALGALVAATVWLAVAAGWAILAAAAGWLARRVAPSDLAEWRVVAGGVVEIGRAHV